MNDWIDMQSYLPNKEIVFKCGTAEIQGGWLECKSERWFALMLTHFEKIAHLLP